MTTDEQNGAYEGGGRNYEEMRSLMMQALPEVEKALESPDCTPELAAALAISLGDVVRMLREIRQRADREAGRLVRELKREARIDRTGEEPSTMRERVMAEVSHAKLVHEIDAWAERFEEPIFRDGLVEKFTAKYPEAPKQVRRAVNVVWRRLGRRYGDVRTTGGTGCRH